MRTRRDILWVVPTMLALSAVAFGVALAAETETEVVIEDQAVAHQINSLNDEIAEKRSNVNSLTRNIEEYKKKIAGLQGSEATVEVEIELLENRAAKTELDIEATREEMSAVDAEIAVLEAQIKAIAEQLERNRSSIADMLRKMDMYDNDLSLQLLFGTDSFAELFARLQELSSVTADLEDALTRAEAEHARLETSRAEQVGKRDRLSELQDQQERQIALLEDERGSKELLLAQTQRSEAQFQAFLSELRQEQQYVNQQIGALQDEVERKLADADSEGQGSDVLSWPVNATRGISATFHDPTYPFRHLFEHSGLDVPVASGTPVTSAAPGYVAWTRTGRMYGNYVMVIHANGVATLYAHLSSIDVEQDQFVGRGETIGLSGGIPGTPGAGLSTGAHLHFEVRVNGIPTDPLNYLYGS